MEHAATPEFTADTVLKRDVFSETRKGHFANDARAVIIRREVGAAPWWSRAFAWFLARREIRVMRAVEGLRGTPNLIAVDRTGLYRTWVEGTPLHLARPQDLHWYRDARRLLREFRRRGVTHNDLAKPQNWLAAPDGSAAVIDFQLASLHRRKGPLYRLMAYEDFRHLIKQKRAFAPHLMTAREKRILARRSLPSRIWLATGKKVYNLVTRGIFNWSDGEGTGDRLDHEGAAIVEALTAHPGVRAVALALYPLPRKGVGIYAFVEAERDVDAAELRSLQRARLGRGGADLIQPVATLPRRADGAPRDDLLRLIAMNQMTELGALTGGDAELARIAAEIAAGRLNFTDRRISRTERPR